MKQRNDSVDILKCIAVLAITNSHMDSLYGEYSTLATGGAIGDALFFFISGFTLFLGGVKSFGNYYKRRINRIYPTVFAWALLKGLFFDSDKGFIDVLISGGGWFVSCIMIYYILLFFVQKYCLNHLKILFTFCIAMSFLLYPLFHAEEHFNIYGNTYYKWFFFFIFMLQGSIMGLNTKTQTLSNIKPLPEILKTISCIICFYGLCAFKSTDTYNFIQIFSIILLLYIIYFIYRFCNAEKIKAIYQRTKIGWCMNFIGSLCLEVYLVQNYLFTDKLNSMFPLNIIIIFIAILLLAYVLRCMGRIWQQTFFEKDYIWREVFRFVNK